MATLYKFALEIIPSIRSFVDLIISIFGSTLRTLVSGFPSAVRVILYPVVEFLDLIGLADVTLLALMFGTGVSVWIIKSLFNFFKVW